MITKQKPYRGVLAEPLALHAPFELTAKNIASIARLFRISAEEVRSQVQALFIRDWDEILRRQRALYDHFGIDRNAPEAERTLALSLAARHEAAILFAAERVDFGALCVHFETNDPPELVRKLASKHVPGFQLEAPKEWQGRLSSLELAKVFFCIFAVIEYLRLRGEKDSIRRVVEIMLDESLLPKVVPTKAARSVQSVLKRTGNKDRNSERDLKSRAKYLRDAISKAWSAWADLKSDRADDFQIQLLSEVWPMLYRLTGTYAGQDDAGLKGKK